MTAVPVVHVVDDDESHLTSVARMLKASGFAVRTFGSGAALLAGVSEEARGCVVADLDMPGLDGLALQEALVKARIHMPVVFLSGHGNIPSTVRAMQKGAVDFIEKHAPGERLLGAIHEALERDAAEADRRGRRADLGRRFSSLTQRELQVLAEVVRGRLNKQIAATLGISERTVKMHRTSITTKVGVHSTAQLATLAREAEVFDDAVIAGGR